MNRNRFGMNRKIVKDSFASIFSSSKKSANKPTSIASISSHVPLLTTNSNAMADVHNVLQSFPMSSSKKQK